MTRLAARVAARAAGRLWSRLTEATEVCGGFVPVLCYHSISEEPGAIAPGRFAAQMRWLRARRYRTVSLDEALQCERDSGRRVVITFDDGSADLEQNALPVLLECGFRALIFFPAGLAGARMWYSPRARGFVGAPQHDAKRLDFMSWEQARTMAAAGMEFHSHGWSHARLTALDEDAIAQELLRSREALEERLRSPVRFLSYPFGDFDERVERIAARLGYAAAATTIPGFNRPGAHPFRLRRVAPSPQDDLAAFAFRLSPAAGWYYRRARLEVNAQ